MNNKDIILFIVVLIVIYLLYKINKLENKEKFTTGQSNTSITESIKNLGIIAKQLIDNNGTYTFPADVIITGNLQVKGEQGIRAKNEIGVYNTYGQNNFIGNKISLENRSDANTKIYSQNNIKITKHDSTNMVDSVLVVENNRVYSNKNIHSDNSIKAGSKAEMKTVGSYGQFGDSSNSKTRVRVGSGQVLLSHSDGSSDGVQIQRNGETKKGRLYLSLFRPGFSIGGNRQGHRVPFNANSWKCKWNESNGDKTEDLLFLKRSNASENIPIFLNWNTAGTAVSQSHFGAWNQFYTPTSSSC